MNNSRQIFKLIGIGFGLAALVMVVVGLLLPKEFHLERSVVINAEPPRIHQEAGRLDRWENWAPWLQADPSVSVEPGHMIEGEGASLTWKNETGGGELEITRSDPAWGLAFDMTLGQNKKLTACSLLYKTLPATTAGPRTEVTWSLQGDSGWDLLERFFNLLLDPLMGPMLEDGLQRLKMQAEEQPVS